MSSASISFNAIDSFRRFLDETPPSELPSGEHHCVADFIQAWVESGYGVRACQGNFQTFLIAVAALIHYWHQDSTVLDHLPSDAEGEEDESKVIERRVPCIFPYGQAIQHVIFDPDFFAKHTFNELHGKRDQ